MRAVCKTLGAALLGLIMVASPAAAVDDHTHAAKYGGKIVESGHHFLEVVARDGALEIHVNGEDGKAEDLQGTKATAAVLSGGKKVDLTLTSDGTNILKGTGDFMAAKGTTIVITLTLPGHGPEQARVKLD